MTSSTAFTPAGHPQIAFVHILRGLAALLVVWSHLSGYWLFTVQRTSAIQDAWYEWIARPFHLYQNAGHLGVVLFFLISGYIITHTSLRETRGSFLIKRVLRIFPALFVAIAITWIIVAITTANGLEVLALRDGPWWRWLQAFVLLDGFTGNSWMLDVTWTLVVELMFYALVFAVLVLQRNRPLLSTWVMTSIWVATCLVFLNVGFFHDMANNSTVYYVGFLLVGRVIYLVQRKLVTAVDGAILGGSVALFIAVFLEAFDPGFLFNPGGSVGYEPVASYAIAVLLFLLLLRLAPRKAHQPFAFLGDISYSLYLLHLPIGFLVIMIVDGWGAPESVTTVVAIAVSVGVSYLSWLGVERPAQRLARRLLQRSRPQLDRASP